MSCVLVLGVDGRRGGWAVAAARVTSSGRLSAVTWHDVGGQDAAGAAAVLDLALRLGAAAVGVDCPIGLPADRWRAADLAAKALLGRASARVFLTPPREVLEAADHATARAVARELLGKGISAQTFGLRRIVLALDAALTRPVPGAGLVVEVHPELSFMGLLGRGPGDALPSKKTAEGRAARLTALAGWARRGVDLDPPDGDDHLDALAAAWSAWRHATGTAVELGDGTRDARGLPMRIVT